MRYAWLCALCLWLAGCRLETPAPAATGEAATPAEERVVGGLQEPVALAFLSANAFLIAERRGAIRLVRGGTLLPQAVLTLPVPDPAGYDEYGLLGLAVDPAYPTRPYVYAFHTVRGANGGAAGQRIVRFTLRNDRGAELTALVDHLPAGTACCHNGGRIIFGTDGMLYATLGDTQRPEQAQRYEALPGKTLRYGRDGGIPADNPLEEQRTGWAGTDGARAGALGGFTTPVYTIGHRNPFGIARHPDTGDLYITENGPDHDDEINRLVAGDNYGWPEVMGPSGNPRYRAPLWSSGRSVIAPTGAAFYTGTDFPQYTNNFFFAAYNDGRLRRAIFTGPDDIARVEVVAAAGQHARLDVAMGRDGKLYYASRDAVYRLVPAR